MCGEFFFKQIWTIFLKMGSGGTQETEAENLCEFEASLVYRVSSRTGSKATQGIPVSNAPSKDFNAGG